MRVTARLGGLITSTVTVMIVVAGLLTGSATAAPAPPTARVGTVLQQTALAPSQLPTGAARGYRLLYVTRDQRGRPVTSTGALYLPRGQAPAGGWPVFSWAHGTSGISDQCSPSAEPGARRDALEPSISRALRSGYAVTATDYPGLGSGGVAEYLGGRAEGYAVIDMIRAGRRVDPQLSRRWVSSGHSQGGHAAIWAAHLAPRYAPELPLKGTVAFAPASQIERIFPVLAPGAPDLGRFNGAAGLLLYVISGLDHARPELHVQDHLTPLGRDWVARARTLCVFQLATALRNVAPGTLVARPFTDPATTAALIDYLAVPAGGYRTPVRIEHGTSDTTVPFPLSVALTAQMRAAGTDVTLIPYPGVDHRGVTRAAEADAFATVAADFARR
ncbi:lipase family protein [Gordonia sp. CPCC 205515]|uniref:lipase family protein n=1 Tax=Gordonia sp. CPCC 205515 TaxID=3140791 RepID=UPI003AF38197